MEFPLLLIVLGIVLAILVHYGLGLALVVIGIVLLLYPLLAGARR